jgi:hypothetical protein
MAGDTHNCESCDGNNTNPNPLDSCNRVGCDNPCGSTGPNNTAACETLPSQIDNFTLQFFGEVVKTEVDGTVVWSLPCQLDTGLPANPRGADEPLGCYILRLFQDGIIGEPGVQGDPGNAGTNGVDAYTVVVAPFATPSLEHPYVQIVTRLNANIVTGENIFIESSGWYNVVGTDGTGVLFCNLISRLSNFTPIVPVGALVVPAGQTGVGVKGEQGDKGLTGDQGIQGPKGQPGNDAVSVTQNNGFFFTTTGFDYNLLAFSDEDFHPVWFSVASPGYPPVTPTAADPRFTLPNAGTYLIVGKTAANVQSNTQIKLFSVTNNFDVPGTTQLIAPSAANEFRHCPFAAIYTAGGADTIQLYASRILGFMDGGLGGANNVVYDIAIQADGKILVAGVFTQMNSTSINGIARINVDGTIDTSFNAGVIGPNVPGVNSGATVYSIGLMADGHIVIGGTFSSYRDTAGSHTVSKFAILNADGTLHADLVTSHATINDNIFAVDIDANNMAVITGAFTTVGGTTRRRIARIQTSGGPGTTGFLDTTFGSTTSGLNDTGRAVKVLASGLVMVGGDFTAAQTTGGGAVAKTSRLSRFDNTTGLPDGTWASTTASQFNSRVYAIEEQTIDVATTGQILVGGTFSSYNGTSSPQFIQLTSAGAVATASAGFNNDVRSIALDLTGNILVAGLFTKFGPATTNQTHLSRIVPGTGALDTSLGDVNIGVAGDTVYKAIVQPDSKILVGGTFVAVQTLPRGRIARLLTDGTLNTVPAGSQTIPYLYTDITWTQIA